MSKRRWGAWALAAGLLSGCGGDEDGAGHGELSVRISGEGATKQGYPYEKNGALLAFADGWKVTFSKYLVSFGELSLRDADGAEGLLEPRQFVTDLHLGDPEVLRQELAAKRWQRFGLRVAAPAGEVQALGAVAHEDLERMRREGYAYWIEGQAESDGDVYTFAWGLQSAAQLSDCTNGLDGTQGFVIRNHAVTSGEITVHADHIFWDSLGSELAAMRFEAFAGASQDDRHITMDELLAAPLADLRDRHGAPLADAAGKPLFYNVGSLPLESPTLGGFVRVAAASQTHLNGLGLCTVTIE